MSEPTLSIVIPTLNAAPCWPGCQSLLQEALAQWGQELEVLVVDGGSEDGTQSLVEAAGFQVLASPPGRGQQLAAGGRAARGRWLLFLHVDSQLEIDWSRAVSDWMARSRPSSVAAYFSLAFDSPSFGARCLERLVTWRNDWLSLPYGDQGLLLSRSLYQDSGGYPDQKLMEDVALVRRLRSRRAGKPVRLQRLPLVLTTSAHRYRQEGWIRRPVKNLLLLLLYFGGWSPDKLARLYGGPAAEGKKG